VITKNDIEKYIQKIPPSPKIVQECIKLLRDGELRKAAEIAKEDMALSSYLRNLVNKPIYGFSKEVKDISQIFGILGVSGSLQSVYNYMLNLLSPDKWSFFDLNKSSFENLQAELSADWNKILKHLNVNDKEIQSSITLLPSSIIVCEALFNEHKKDVELIREAKDLDLNTILKRLSNYTLFDISEMIARKWDMNEKIIQIIKASSANSNITDEEILKYAKWMHLLFFYILSKPTYIEAGLNDFIEFNVDFVIDIYEEFNEIMEIKS
jgi:HD-like signal output (HDOD) protein